MEGKNRKKRKKNVHTGIKKDSVIYGHRQIHKKNMKSHTKEVKYKKIERERKRERERELGGMERGKKE